MAQETPRVNIQLNTCSTKLELLPGTVQGPSVQFKVNREGAQSLWGKYNRATVLQNILDCQFLVHLLALASGPNYIIFKQQLRYFSLNMIREVYNV